MTRRLVFAISVLVPCLLGTPVARAQDVPGIEICTVEKTMERRTSCLQSNVEFLQKTIARLDLQHQQKLDAANRQIEGLKASLAALQKVVEDLQAAPKELAEDPKKTDAAKDSSTKDASTKDTPTKDAPTKDAPTKDAPAKDGAKDGAAKAGGK